MGIWKEREDTIVSSIMSGNNACGTLAKAVSAGGEDLERYLRSMVFPTLRVCADEARQKDQDIIGLAKDNETKRFALEFAAANLAIPEGQIKEAFRKALPGHPLL